MSIVWNSIASIFRFARSSASTDQDFLGCELSKFGKFSRWNLAGRALQDWEETFFHHTRHLIGDNENIVQIQGTKFVIHCWMMGHQASDASLTVVVACEHRQALKSMMEVLANDDVLKENGYTIRGALIRDLLHTSAPKCAQLVGGDSSTTIRGRQFVCLSTKAKATIGGCVLLDGVPFGLTAAHPFMYGAATPTLHPTPIEECDIFETAWALGSTDEELNIDGGHLTKPAGGRSGFRDTHEETWSPMQDETGSKVALICPPPQHNSGQDLDWALLVLDDLDMSKANGPWALYTNSLPPYLATRKLRTNAPRGAILVVIKDRLIRGQGSGVSCLIRVNVDSSPVAVWSAHFFNALDSGSSGSWVLDAENGDLYGVLFAASNSLQEHYIIPAIAIFQDIYRLTGKTVTLPSINNGDHLGRSQDCDREVDQHGTSTLCDKKELTIRSRPTNDSVLLSGQCGRTLRPELIDWDVFALIINKMIGIGIFTSPGVVLILAGSKLVALGLWIAGFVVSFISVGLLERPKFTSFLAVSPSQDEKIFKERIRSGPQINSLVPSSISTYISWVLVIITMVNGPGNSIRLGRLSYAALERHEAFPQQFTEAQRLTISILFVLFLVISSITALSHNTALFLNRWLGILKIMILLALVMTGLVMGAAQPIVAPMPITDVISTPNRLSNLLAAFALVLFSFQGWETSSFHYRRTQPDRPIMNENGSYIAVTVVGMLYVAVNVTFYYSAIWESYKVISTSQTWIMAIFLVSLLDNVIIILFDGSAIIALLKSIKTKLPELRGWKWITAPSDSPRELFALTTAALATTSWAYFSGIPGRHLSVIAPLVFTWTCCGLALYYFWKYLRSIALGLCPAKGLYRNEYASSFELHRKMFRKVRPLSGRAVLVILITIAFVSITMDLAKFFWNYNVPSSFIENIGYASNSTRVVSHCVNDTGDDFTPSICDFIDRAVWHMTEGK